MRQARGRQSARRSDPGEDVCEVRRIRGCLRTLVDTRDGTVHAALDEEVEQRLLVAFVKHADALLADLGRDRAEFWGGQLAVVDALLAKAGNKVTRDLAVKLAAARAYFAERYGKEIAELLGC